MKKLSELKENVEIYKQRKLKIKMECIEDRIQDSLIDNKKIADWYYLEGLENETINILKNEGYNAKIKRYFFIYKFIRIYL